MVPYTLIALNESLGSPGVQYRPLQTQDRRQRCALGQQLRESAGELGYEGWRCGPAPAYQRTGALNLCPTAVAESAESNKRKLLFASDELFTADWFDVKNPEGKIGPSATLERQREVHGTIGWCRVCVCVCANRAFVYMFDLYG